MVFVFNKILIGCKIVTAIVWGAVVGYFILIIYPTSKDRMNGSPRNATKTTNGNANRIVLLVLDNLRANCRVHHHRPSSLLVAVVDVVNRGF